MSYGLAQALAFRRELQLASSRYRTKPYGFREALKTLTCCPDKSPATVCRPIRLRTFFSEIPAPISAQNIFSKSRGSAVGKATKLRFGARISVEAREFLFSKTSGPNSGSGYYGEDNYFLPLPGMKHRILGCPPHSLVMVVRATPLLPPVDAST